MQKINFETSRVYDSCIYLYFEKEQTERMVPVSACIWRRLECRAGYVYIFQLPNRTTPLDTLKSHVRILKP